MWSGPRAAHTMFRERPDRQYVPFVSGLLRTEPPMPSLLSEVLCRECVTAISAKVVPSVSESFHHGCENMFLRCCLTQRGAFSMKSTAQQQSSTSATPPQCITTDERHGSNQSVIHGALGKHDLFGYSTSRIFMFSLEDICAADMTGMGVTPGSSLGCAGL